MEEITLSLWDHILFILIGIVFPFFSLFQRSAGIRFPRFTSQQKKSLYISNSVIMWLPTAVIMLEWWLKNRSFGIFWFDGPAFPESVWAYIGIFFLIFLAETLTGISSKEKVREARRNFQQSTPFMPTKPSELPLFSVMAFTAGFTEEVIFRAFCMHYLYATLPMSPNTFYVIIIIPAVIFAIVHLYQGPEAVVKILAFGLLFGFIYFYSQSLWLVIALHFIVDMISGLISVYIIRGPANVHTP